MDKNKGPCACSQYRAPKDVHISICEGRGGETFKKQFTLSTLPPSLSPRARECEKKKKGQVYSTVQTTVVERVELVVHGVAGVKGNCTRAHTCTRR